MSKVKTTQIKKKFKDKKTGEWKETSITYAKVPDRLKKFWEDNPRGKIETIPTILDDGRTMFKVHIVMDKTDDGSRETTAHALSSEDLGTKDFEKLETIAVGRALALIGYAGDGEIASSEEMEEYLKWQEEKKKEKMEEMIYRLESSKTLDELRTAWASIDGLYRTELEEIKNKCKEKIQNENK